MAAETPTPSSHEEQQRQQQHGHDGQVDNETERVVQLNKWLQRNKAKPPLKTSVSDPHSTTPAGAFSTTSTIFTVETLSQQGEQWCVERSFADFVLLRTTLSQCFLGAVLPQLPVELPSLVDGLKKSREERRVKQGDILHHFLRLLARHPFFSQDETFILFLSHANVNPASFAQVVRERNPNQGKSTSPFSLSKIFTRRSSKSNNSMSRSTRSSSRAGVEDYSAADWWKEAVELAVEPADPQQICRQALGEIDRFKRKMGELKVAVRDLRDKMKSLSESSMQLEQALESACDGETAPMAAQLLHAQAAKFRAQGDLHLEMAASSSATLLSAVRGEMLVLDAFKEQILHVRDVLNREEEAKQTVQRRERELAQLEHDWEAERYRDGGNFAFADREEPKRLRAARKAKEEALGILYSTSYDASMLTRSTLTIEVNLFREERVQRAQAFFEDFAQVHAAYSMRSMQVWSKMRAEGGAGASQEEERLVAWDHDVAWDASVPRLVQVVFDFDAENEDEITARTGDRGTAVPLDGDRQWLHLTLANERGAGLIPTDFVRLVGVVSPSPPAAAVQQQQQQGLAEKQIQASRMEVEKLEQELGRKDAALDKQARELSDVQREFAALKLEMDAYKRNMEESQAERDAAMDALATLQCSLEEEKEAAAAKEEERVRIAREEEEERRKQALERTESLATPPKSDELPPHWTRHLDSARQKYYYHNSVTKETVWKLPKTPSSAASPSPSSSSATKRKQREEWAN